jgi:hypothetical protein
MLAQFAVKKFWQPLMLIKEQWRLLRAAQFV